MRIINFVPENNTEFLNIVDATLDFAEAKSIPYLILGKNITTPFFSFTVQKI